MKFKVNIFLFIYAFWSITAALIAKEIRPDPNKGLFYIASPKQVAIDGSLDEWSNQAPVFLNRPEQAKYTRGDWGGPKDCSAKFWMGWNKLGFIIAVETIDDSAAFPFSGTDLWMNDCIQFAIDVHDDNAPNFYQSDDREFVISMSDTQSIIYEFSYTPHRKSGIRHYPCQVTVSGDTIRYEAIIPWRALGIIGPFAGMHFGASVIIFDNDGQQFRGWLEWTAGVTRKKFTLPFANVLLFDPKINLVQAIPTQPFLSINDTLTLWVYSRYYRKNVNYRLFEKDETLFRKSTPIKSQKWTKLSIPPKYLTWGQLKLEVNSVRISRQFDIAVWSKQLITEQIGYLTQQVQVFNKFKNINPTAAITINYWINWIEKKFSSAVTDFDFYNVMNQTQKRIDQIPNFYMKKQVFYNRELRIVEKLYQSKREARVKRYLLYLPPDFKRENKYPLFVFLHNNRDNEEESARKLGTILSKFEIPVIGVFPRNYLDLGITHFGIDEIAVCLDDVSKDYPVDKNKIFLIGEGSGGVEAVLLTERYPDKFAALATIFSKLDTTISAVNLSYTPLWIFANQQHNQSDSSLVAKIRNYGGHVKYTSFLESDIILDENILSLDFFQWLLKQQRITKPLKIKLDIVHLRPRKAFWLEFYFPQDYLFPAHIEAAVDSNHIVITTENLSEFSLLTDKFPDSLSFPLQVTVDTAYTFHFPKKQSKIILYKAGKQWRKRKKLLEHLQKSAFTTGPLSAIFDQPIKFVYSTKHEDNDFNKLSFQLAKRSSQRGRSQYLDHLLIADTVMVKQKVNSNIITFGNTEANAYLKKLYPNLPISIYKGGLKFGNSYCTAEGCAAIFVYPNPDNPDYLILAGVAPDMSGLKNIDTIWDLNYKNNIYSYDYIIIRNGVARYQYQSWVEFGHFDRNWSVPWFHPPFGRGPQHWFTDIKVGLDANQLSLNNNWKGGGKGNFTWKIYLRMEWKYIRERYNWKNSLYCAFGQISVQEDENWLAPEKSTDIIDFDSVVKLTLKKFIDPYLAFSMNTQFHEGYNRKTKQLISRFANPLQMSQSAGFARNLHKDKKLQLTTRVGYAAKEIIATQPRFRKLWTGDEAKWMKIDGGVEWLTESKSVFKPGVVLTNKIKFFKALFSSISPLKDPENNWRKIDVYWEQMFSAKLTQYVVFNVVMKFIYDRDTSKGGQFLENASLGLSYKF